ncbi:unnamed protein product [Heligmosomoides polygyrus]|uniref:Aa_trans domain-containing protein n=1 Tax=Heligmosomoides polygyrus TaxID=6339 RepID=A0A183GAT3_HELPZ|nr:unnamed protein product [Heligmosomoides polygyrus]
MTIATSIQQPKLQDSVESDSMRVIAGASARRLVYLVYIACVVISAAVLYLFPSAVVISGFVVVQVLLLASLYPLVKFAIKTEDHDLVWDQDGLHWFRQCDMTNSCEQSYRDTPLPANQFLSYAFI